MLHRLPELTAQSGLQGKAHCPASSCLTKAKMFFKIKMRKLVKRTVRKPLIV